MLFCMYSMQVIGNYFVMMVNLIRNLAIFLTTLCIASFWCANLSMTCIVSGL